MRFQSALCALLSIATIPAFAQLQEDAKRQFDDAERRIVRLSPAKFPELPSNTARELQRRGCRIPQPWDTTKRHNIIKGEFTRAGQTD